MENIEDQQRAEIEVLKSIYADDFIESPPPKAWKVRLSSNLFVTFLTVGIIN